MSEELVMSKVEAGFIGEHKEFEIIELRKRVSSLEAAFIDKKDNVGLTICTKDSMDVDDQLKKLTNEQESNQNLVSKLSQVCLDLLAAYVPPIKSVATSRRSSRCSLKIDQLHQLLVESKPSIL